MRLFRDVDDAPLPARAVPSLEICIREPLTGRVIAELVLRLSETSDRLSNMLPAANTVQRADSVPTPHESTVAGRIISSRAPISEALDAWLENLRDRRKKPSTLKVYRSDTARVIREAGWASTQDITFDSVTTWLGSHHEWKGTTYNRYLQMLKSFTTFLASSGRLQADPLLKVHRSEDDGDEGSRAATTDEARAIMRACYIRASAEKRGKAMGCEAYFACLFLAGCRFEEPGKWKRRHALVFMDPPRILWTKDISKNRRKQEQVINNELAAVLRAHIAGVDAARATERESLRRAAEVENDPIRLASLRARIEAMREFGPDDPVFPVVPNRASFRKDRVNAQVAYEDHLGQPLTPHSARKWYRTTLASLGVHPDFVNHLARHKESTEQRYTYPSLAEQSESVNKLPTICANALAQREINGHLLKTSQNRLTDGGQIAEDTPANRPPIQKPQLDYRNRQRDAVDRSQNDSTAPLPVPAVEPLRSAAKVIQQLASDFQGTRHYEVENADFRTYNGDGLEILADLFGVLERLIRNGMSHGSGERNGERAG